MGQSRTTKLIGFLYDALFVLTPLIVVPWASELFEFNKMLFVILLSTLVAFLLGRQALNQGRLILAKTPWDLPLIIFLFSQVLSTLFSIDRHTSIWGYYSRFHGGLLSTLAYLVLYFGLTTWLVNQKKRTHVINHFALLILLTSTLVNGYGFLQHPNPLFRNQDGGWQGIDADRWIQNVQERVFSTLGQPNWLAAYVAMTLPLTWYFILKRQSDNKAALPQLSPPSSRRLTLGIGSLRLRMPLPFPLTACYFLLSLLMFWVLLFAKSRAGLVGLAVGLVVFLLFLLWARAFPYLKKSSLVFLSLLIFSYLALLLISGRPLLGRFSLKFNPPPPMLSSPSSTSLPSQSPPIPDDTAKIRSVVWHGALTVFRHYPIFGSGVETFAYAYWHFRPQAHNLTSEWEFLYNKAHNEYLNILATTGIFGFAAYSFLVLVFVASVIKQLTKPLTSPLAKQDKELAATHLLLASLLSGFISGLVSQFWGFSVVSTALFFFLYPAFCFSLVDRPKTRVINLPRGKPKLLARLMLFLTFIFVLIQIGFVFTADLFFAQGSRLAQVGDHLNAYHPLKIATTLRPGEPVFHDQLAFSTSALAVSSLEATAAAKLANEAIGEVEKTLKLGLINVNYWKTAARIFSELAQLDSSLYEQALVSVDQAQTLAPTDPKLPYNQGLILLEQALLDDDDFVAETNGEGVIPEGLVQQALDAFQKAIELKFDYRDAHYALAVTEHELAVDPAGDIRDEARYQRALEELRFILKITQPPDYQAGEKLREWGR